MTELLSVLERVINLSKQEPVGSFTKGYNYSRSTKKIYCLKDDYGDIDISLHDLPVYDIYHLYFALGFNFDNLLTLFNLFHLKMTQATLMHNEIKVQPFKFDQLYGSSQHFNLNFPLKDRLVNKLVNSFYKMETRYEHVPKIQFKCKLIYRKNYFIPYFELNMPLARKEYFKLKISNDSDFDFLTGIIEKHLKIRMKEIITNKNIANKNITTFTRQEFKDMDFETMCQHMVLNEMICI